MSEVINESTCIQSGLHVCDPDKLNSHLKMSINPWNWFHSKENTNKPLVFEISYIDLDPFIAYIKNHFIEHKVAL